MKTKETIYETYIRTICSNCKNKGTDLCCITKDINGVLKCCYYERETIQEGYKNFKGITANRNKPIMKNILRGGI